MCIRKMPSRKNNKRTRETSLLQMDSATFQAVVMAAVTAAMAQINANNPNGGRNSIDNSSQRNKHGNQQVTTCQGTPNPKLKSRKLRSRSKRKGKHTQGFSRKPHVVAVHATMTPITQATRRPYAGNLPKCNQCKFHHNGACREMHCNKCNRKNHIAKFCRTYPCQNRQPNENDNNRNNPNNNTNDETSHTCYGCGGTGHFRHNCPNANNQGAEGSVRVLTLGQGEAVQDPTVVTGTFPLNNSFAYLLFNRKPKRSFVSNIFKHSLKQ